MKKQNGDAKDQELMITQEELRELIKLEKVKHQAEQLRESIRNRALQGAKIEPGKLKVSVTSEKKIQLNQKSIRVLLGALGNEILASLPRQIIYKMFVRSYASSKHEPKPAAVVDPSEVNNTVVPGEESELVTVVLDALRTIDVSHPNTQSLRDKLTTLIELKTKPLKLSDDSAFDGFDDISAYEEEAFLESFRD
jgi:hypothetical protein